VWLFYAFKRLGVVLSGPPPALGAAARVLLVAAVPFAAARLQVAVGRSDMQRGHRALSLTFWAGVLVWLAVLGGLLVRERAVTPAALATRSVSGARRTGARRDLGQHRSRRGRVRVRHRIGPLAAPGLAAGRPSRPTAGTSPGWKSRRSGAATARRRSSWRGSATAASTSSRWSSRRGCRREGSISLALAPQADRLAVVQQRTLSLFELPSGRAISSSSASDGDWVAAAFLPDGQLRTFRRVRPAVGPPGAGTVPGRIEVVSLKGGVPESATRLTAVGHALLCSPADGDLVLLQEPPNRYSLHDPRTGRLVRTFSGEDGFQVGSARLLEDGARRARRDPGADAAAACRTRRPARPGRGAAAGRGVRERWAARPDRGRPLRDLARQPSRRDALLLVGHCGAARARARAAARVRIRTLALGPSRVSDLRLGQRRAREARPVDARAARAAPGSCREALRTEG
jgi:hypothetical protein